MLNLFFSKKITRFAASLLLAAAVAALAGCGGGEASSSGSSTTPPPTPVPTAASLDISASPATVKSDGSNTTTISVVALNEARAGVSGVIVTMGADKGILGAATVTTDASGKGTATFSAGSGGVASTATITATAGSASANVKVQIVIAGSSSATAASLNLAASPATVKSDGSNTSTITVTALNSTNAAVPGVTITLGATTGILGAATLLTDNAGKATATFSAGGGSINRTATITATADGVSTQLPMQITGSLVTLASSGSSLPDDGKAPATLTVTAKDAGGSAVPNAAVTLSKTGTGNVTITPASGVTDSAGKFTATAAGAAGGAGAVTVTAAALGATATTALTVTPTAVTFAIDQQKLNGVVIANDTTTAMNLSQSLEIRVNAVSAATVSFATTTGAWNGTGGKVVSVPVVAGKATATLTTTQAGIASVQVYDAAAPATSDTLAVAMTSATAASITVQASPSVVPRSVGTTVGASTLIAMVRDAQGFPVGGAPVAFSIVNPTGGGETVAPVVVYTAATPAGGLNLGEARASFASGSLSTAATGVKVRAAVVGTSVSTGTPPSASDATIVIGGTAGSVAFGQATVISTGPDNATYVLDMSVLVSDSNGNPAPLGTVVNLSAWPKAWSSGNNCGAPVEDPTAPGTFIPGTGITGTFVNEDANENLIIDPSEDGTRLSYDVLTGAIGAPGPAGTIDGFLTPTNSAAGSLPATVTTDASGVAAFKLTYTKASAIWIVDRIRARTVVQGSDAVGEIVFRLQAAKPDVDPDCLLPNSPYLK